MSTDTLVRTWKDPSLREVSSVTDPAGGALGVLSIGDLREDYSAPSMASSGWVCTLTIECGTWVCACL